MVGALGAGLLCSPALGQSIQVTLCGLQEGLRELGEGVVRNYDCLQTVPALRADSL